MSRTGDAAMRSNRLLQVLQRAGVIERRLGGRGDLFSEPVLVVSRPRIYDQDGNLRATIRSSADNASLAKHLFWTAPWVREVVDVNDQILLRLEDGQRRFRSIAVDGTEIASIVLPLHAKRREDLADRGEYPDDRGSMRRRRKRTWPIEANGETIGDLRYRDHRRAFSVRDADDAEIARVTNIRGFWRNPCNVIEIDDRMPNALRPLVLAASACVFDLTAPSNA